MHVNTLATPAATSNSNSGATTTKSDSQLNTESFLKLLTAQMANQNPLEPVKDTEYFAQLAQLGTVQGIDNLKLSMAVTQAQSLMGKQVTASTVVNGQSQMISGTVTGMSSSGSVVSVVVTGADGTSNTIDVTKIQTTSNTSSATGSIGDYANLIGQSGTGTGTVTINGVAKSIPVTGTIVGMSLSNGQAVARIQTSQYGVVNVGVGSLTQVGS